MPWPKPKGIEGAPEPMLAAALVAASITLAAALLCGRQARRAAAWRAGLLSECAARLDAARLGRDRAGFATLDGGHDGAPVAVRLIPEALVHRRLPQLWLSVSLRLPLPVEATLDVLRRPAGAEFYAPRRPAAALRSAVGLARRHAGARHPRRRGAAPPHRADPRRHPGGSPHQGGAGDAARPAPRGAGGGGRARRLPAAARQPVRPRPCRARAPRRHPRRGPQLAHALSRTRSEPIAHARAPPDPRHVLLVAALLPGMGHVWIGRTTRASASPSSPFSASGSPRSSPPPRRASSGAMPAASSSGPCP